jgi:hypothetical protein
MPTDATPSRLLAGLIDLADPGRPPHHGGRPCGALCVPACTAARVVRPAATSRSRARDVGVGVGPGPRD